VEHGSAGQMALFSTSNDAAAANEMILLSRECGGWLVSSLEITMWWCV
jgi:hypothetical protein